jgi:hypothetical protein
MAKYLAKFTSMMDEVEINGFVIMSDSEVENFEELASSINWEFSYKFGEDDQYQLDFSDGEDLLSRVEFKEINASEAITIKRLFNDEFGVFIGEEFLTSVIGDEDSDFDEDDEDDDFIEYDKEY